MMRCVWALWLDGWAEELYTPGLTEDVQRVHVGTSLGKDFTEVEEEFLSIHTGKDHDQLPGRLVGDVDETVRVATGHADNFTGRGFKAPAIHLKEISSFEDAEYFCFMMAVKRRTKSGSVLGFDDGQSMFRGFWRKLYDELKADGRDFQDGTPVIGRTKELKRHQEPL